MPRFTPLLTTLLSFCPFIAFAEEHAPTYPDWWLDYGVVDAADFPPPPGPDDTYGTFSQEEWDAWKAANKAPANLGQLKHIATQAKVHIDQYLVPTPSEWDTVYAPYANPFPFHRNEDDRGPVTIGQLKYVADGIYSMLELKGFPVESDIAARLGSDWTEVRPWTATPSDDENSAPVALGQLKFVFSFDVSTWAAFLDVDNDGFNDAWEAQIVDYSDSDGIESVEDVLPEDDFDGDYLTNQLEWDYGSNPTVADTVLPDAPDDYTLYSGLVLDQQWTSVSGTQFSSITALSTWPKHPNRRIMTDALAYRSTSEVNTGRVTSGYIVAPADGEYTFYLSGESNVQLWFSSDEMPTFLSMLAEVTSETSENAWDDSDLDIVPNMDHAKEWCTFYEPLYSEPL